MIPKQETHGSPDYYNADIIVFILYTMRSTNSSPC